MDIGYFIDDDLVGSREYKEGKVDQSLWGENHDQETYNSLFDDSTSDHKAIGEKSADYLFLPQCHARIMSFNSDMKLLIVLRNPVDRAWSMYWNEFAKGRISKPFKEHIKEEKKLIDKSDYALDHLSFVERGKYDVSITKLFNTFNSEQVKIVILEELLNKPKEVLSEVYDFLEVDTHLGYENMNKKFNQNWVLLKKHAVKENALYSKFDDLYYFIVRKFFKIINFKNKRKRRDNIIKWMTMTRLSKKDLKIDKALRSELIRIYKPHILNLETIIQKDLKKWLAE